MYDRGSWFLTVIMLSLHPLCCLPSEEAKAWWSMYHSVSVTCISPSLQLGLLTPTSTLIILSKKPHPIIVFIIHQTHYEKSDWSRSFNQFTIACELDMINAISPADIAFIMSSSTSAWLLSPSECSPQKQNGWTLRFCFWGWIMWKMYNKTIIEFGFRMISWIITTLCLCYLPQVW